MPAASAVVACAVSLTASSMAATAWAARVPAGLTAPAPSATVPSVTVPVSAPLPELSDPELLSPLAGGVNLSIAFVRSCSASAYCFCSFSRFSLALLAFSAALPFKLLSSEISPATLRSLSLAASASSISLSPR